eukprot:5524905-Prymnesium_polylepis.1
MPALEPKLLSRALWLDELVVLVLDVATHRAEAWTAWLTVPSRSRATCRGPTRARRPTRASDRIRG